MLIMIWVLLDHEKNEDDWLLKYETATFNKLQTITVYDVLIGDINYLNMESKTNIGHRLGLILS